MFYIIPTRDKIQIRVSSLQWYTAFHTLNRTAQNINNSIGLRKLLPSAANIYSKYITLDQREAILDVQSYIINKINRLEGNVL